MPKTISPSEKRGWLEKYKGGKSEAEIARQVGKNLKTVKLGIEWARNEELATSAQAELVKEALRRHQEKLLGLIAGVQDSLVMPREDAACIADLKDNVSKMMVPGAVIDYDQKVGLTVGFTVEEEPEWELLQEHLKRDKMWGAIRNWKSDLVHYVKALKKMSLAAEFLLQDTTGLKLDNDVTKRPFLSYDHTIGTMCELALITNAEKSKLFNLDDYLTADRDRGIVLYGSGAIMAECPGSEEECRVRIIEAFMKLQKDNAVSEVIKIRTNLRESMDKAKRPVKEITLLGLVPGRCRVCKRLGL